MAENGNDGKDDEDTSSWRPPQRQLRTDGRMTGDLPIGPPDPKPLTPSAETRRAGLPTLEALTTSELELDTVNRGNRPKYEEPGAYRPEVIPSRRRPILWVVIFLVLGAAALAAFALIPGLQRSLPLPAASKGNLVIYSEPSGATVKIAGKNVGETPWAGDNLWSGEVKYEISAAGFKPKWGTFHGGAEVKLNVELTKK